MIKIEAKKFIPKITFENILIAYIILHPILDILTSLCVRHVSENLSLGIIIRSIFMIFIVVYTAIKVDKKTKWQILSYYFLIIIYSLFYIINSCAKNDFSIIFTQTKGLIKTFYFPIILASLLAIYKNKNYSSKQKYLNISLLIYILTIIICMISSIGYPTYRLQNNLGTIGLFYSGNEIGAIISLLCPICFCTFITKKFNWFLALLCMATVFVMLEIGTKVAFVSIIGTVALSLIISVIRIIKKEDKALYKQLIIIILIILLTLSFIQYTPIGKNLNIKIFSFDEFYSTPKNITEEISTDPKPPVVDDPIKLLSGRNIFLSNTVTEYKRSSMLDKFFGMGYVLDNEDAKLIEIDYFDIFFCHGIFGALIYVIPLVLIAIILIKKFFTNFLINIKNYSVIFIIYSILIGFAIALIAGHVLTAPSASMFLILNILELWQELKYKGEKFE